MSRPSKSGTFLSYVSKRDESDTNGERDTFPSIILSSISSILAARDAMTLSSLVNADGLIFSFPPSLRL